MIKKIISISDISCMGRCSQTVALPVISAMGINVNVIPTAVLSTQTDGFSEYTFSDFTKNMMPIANHWKSLGLNFDGIYTGFLGSPEQAEIVSEIIGFLGKNCDIKIIDPVLGDGGSLYSCFNEKNVMAVEKLVGEADYITPNYTEACVLTGSDFRDGKKKALEHTEELLLKLTEKGVKKNAVITGIYDGNMRGTGFIDCATGKISYYFAENVKCEYPGAGDLFASVLTGCLVKGIAFDGAVKNACTFVSKCIKTTAENGGEPRYGIDFEQHLYELNQMN